jgi:hypothetical protein
MGGLVLGIPESYSLALYIKKNTGKIICILYEYCQQRLLRKLISIVFLVTMGDSLHDFSTTL